MASSYGPNTMLVLKKANKAIKQDKNSQLGTEKYHKADEVTESEQQRFIFIESKLYLKRFAASASIAVELVLIVYSNNILQALEL